MSAVVTFLLIIAVSAVAGFQLRQPCDTTEQCLALWNNTNTECDPKVKRCLCATGYGVDNEETTEICQKYPFHKWETVQFEVGTHLQCEVLSTSLTEIRWFRNGRYLCTHGSSTCSQEKNTTYVADLYLYRRSVQLKSVIQNDTYTCRAINIEDGREWTVSETEIYVSPKSNFTTVRVFGSDDNVYCSVATPNLQVRLVRDGKEFCTPDAKWCSERPGIGGSYTFFNVYNLRANHTFTCEIYSDNKKLSTVSIHRFIIVPKTEIFELTFYPPGALAVGTELVAIARFQSSLGVPVRRWKIDGVLITNNDELRILSEKEYESKAFLGPIYDSCILTLEVSSNYGSDTKKFYIDVETTTSGKTSRSSEDITVDWTSGEPSSEPTKTTGRSSTSIPVPALQGRKIFIKDSVLNIFLYPVKKQIYI